MRDFPARTRCVAPVRAKAGLLSCVVQAAHCDYPHHRTWQRFAWPMRLLWWIKPWWPNKLGRAMDREGRGQAGRGHALNDRLDRDSRGAV